MNKPTRQEYEQMMLHEEVFAKKCFPGVMEVDTPEFHKNLYRQLSDRNKKFVAVIAPRGHAKSTLSTTFVPLHRMLFGVERNILLISESETQAKAHLENIKYHLETNQQIKHYFPNLEFVKWAEDQIVIRGGPFDSDCQILVRGITQRMRGLNYHNKRPTLIIMDDVESESNMDNPDLRNRIKSIIDSVVIPARDIKSGRVFMIGTIVHFDSYLNEILINSKAKKHHVGKSGRWHYTFYQAIKNFGTNKEKALWPEWHSLEELHAERNEMASKDREFLWFREYMNQPVAASAQIFKPEYFKERHNYHVQYRFGQNWLIDKTTDQIYTNCNVFIGVDPAISTKKHSDYFALAILAITASGKKFVIDVKLGRIKSASAQANLILTYAFNYHATAIGIETVAYQQALATQVKERMQESGNYYRILEFKPRDRKNERLKNLEWPLRTGRMKFPKKTGDRSDVEKTIQQFLDFPKSRKDDGMDGVYYADKISIEPPKVTESSKLVQQRESRQPTFNWKVL